MNVYNVVRRTRSAYYEFQEFVIRQLCYVYVFRTKKISSSLYCLYYIRVIYTRIVYVRAIVPHFDRVVEPEYTRRCETAPSLFLTRQ